MTALWLLFVFVIAGIAALLATVDARLRARRRRGRLATGLALKRDIASLMADLPPLSRQWLTIVMRDVSDDDVEYLRRIRRVACEIWTQQ